ncbi:MAG: D-alanyl-D-alaninecarboxypeptidase/D-alanyl-D-alanine-endopeptidase [Frankiales bacterium]|nr:D-alanyl-D-alaninecarboxypeptidase/D-alanyl-D-alanine-endopeptidase [Frankiales bacterium]
MRRLLALPLTAPLLAGLLLLGGPAHAATSSSLRTQVEAALAGSSARSVAVAVDVDGLGAVDRRGSTAPLPPASTEKLFTAETALRLLGPDYRQRTELRTVGAQYGPLLRGDLYLVASGDAFLTSAQLDGLARSFATTGIKTISGHLVVDDTRYDRVRRGAGWKSTWVPQESGPLSAMAVDGNQWRHDAAFLADPATPVLSKLRAYLDRKGIRFTTADARLGPAPTRAAVLAGVSSAPLSATVTRILKTSDNFAAELLLKEVGRVGRGTGSSAAGVQVVHDRTGAGGSVVDGSGLSPYDRQTTAHELELLQSSFDDLKTKLPVGCRDGTLLHRFCGTAASGRVYAKTGTLDTSRALAGWTYTRDGHLVTFSFLLSGFTSGTAATKAIDRAVVVLAGGTVS